MLSGDKIWTGRRPFHTWDKANPFCLVFYPVSAGGFLAQWILFFSADTIRRCHRRRYCVACLSVRGRLYIEKFNLLPCTRRRQILTTSLEAQLASPS